MHSATDDSAPAIGIIGGTGLYRFFSDDDAVLETEVDTPFGPPSAPLRVATVDERRLVFLPRHGAHHEYLPHRIPYRANLWALRALGVRRVIGACAVGGLRPDQGPGTIVVPDQLIDRTTQRAQTFFDRPEIWAGATRPDGPVHVQFADPYCPGLRESLSSASADVIDGGTMVVIEGPRFSTRAESRWYATEGASLINMTGQPEAALARELKMCYSAACLVTDLDAGIEAGMGVTAAEVFAEFARSLPRLVDVIRAAIESIDAGAECDCGAAEHDVDSLFATGLGTTLGARPTAGAR
ncbi:S-methyl-5'-thioadenosine phosphorylase [Streptomyces sp. SID6673]|nr:S-methyl-5'-thioadenosine phosphorylase [Streptomyces sp. SID11726]NEB25258.1 S-methyl-5'-thioadenosine phosphorylase [Streptomyces sp. SID6673]